MTILGRDVGCRDDSVVVFAMTKSQFDFSSNRNAISFWSGQMFFSFCLFFPLLLIFHFIKFGWWWGRAFFVVRFSSSFVITRKGKKNVDTFFDSCTPGLFDGGNQRNPSNSSWLQWNSLLSKRHSRHAHANTHTYTQHTHTHRRILSKK